MKPAREISPDEALARLQNLCSSMEKCSGDIREKLKKWNLPEQDRDRILEKLKKDKFIDDIRFTGFFVREKQRINRWGKEKIRFALKVKGLDQEIINNALSELPSEDFETALRDLLLKKSKELGKYEHYEKKNRLIRFAIQRGFEYDLVFRIIDDFI